MIDINKLLGSKRVEVSFPETAVPGGSQADAGRAGQYHGRVEYDH